MSKTCRVDSFFNMLLNPVGVAYSIITSIPNAMIIIDSHFKIRFVNDRYLKITNRTREELLDKTIADARPNTNLQKTVETGQTMTDLVSNTISNATVDMSIPLFFKDQIMGGISLLKENERIFQLHKSLEKALAINKTLSQEINSYKHNASYQAQYSFDDLLGESVIFKNAVKMAKKIATYSDDVLIVGESGTGKEMFSQAIHRYSQRKNMPFIPVNCSTFTQNLIESELFGYEPGSFTGADKHGKPGLFLLADQGTLMLDEISELPFELQAKLLRVLQERRVRKIGGSKETPLDVRVIAVTNKDPLLLVKNGLFREDLFYRLSMFTVRLPGLKERAEDIELLANHLLREWNMKYGRDLKFSDSACQNLRYHSWPGNIRELKNVVFFAAYTAESNVIGELPVQTAPQISEINFTALAGQEKPLEAYVEEFESRIVRAMLKKHGDSLDAKKKIADILKISLPTLYNKIKQMKKQLD